MATSMTMTMNIVYDNDGDDDDDDADDDDDDVYGNDGDDESQLQTTNELLTLRGEDMQRVLMGSYVHPLSSKAQHSTAPS